MRPDDAVAALDSARGGDLAEGAVGGGTGMVCYGFKGGSGTASRRVALGDAEYTVGVFLQANFGSMPELTIQGVPIGAPLEGELAPQHVAAQAAPGAPQGAGSVIDVIRAPSILIDDARR